ncbi:uncharacterized protein M6B38_197660 [Iris pallida]|uniref:Uncharacterized protein n=1 Tax=Iris pallida TaxID=29817 RepID=A0AAX6EB69_IRIPA|nr:uncharacterized protein M6B38_197660 [Iris pallida]
MVYGPSGGRTRRLDRGRRGRGREGALTALFFAAGGLPIPMMAWSRRRSGSPKSSRVRAQRTDETSREAYQSWGAHENDRRLRGKAQSRRAALEGCLGH